MVQEVEMLFLFEIIVGLIIVGSIIQAIGVWYETEGKIKLGKIFQYIAGGYALLSVMFVVLGYHYRIFG
jgi:cytochrome bd-type quinol oxidase subunit 1